MLRLNSPWRGTGWFETWTFSGKDGRTVRDCCLQLDTFSVEDPEDRGQAAVVLYWIDFAGQSDYQVGPNPPVAGAWNIEGAARLADLLPDSLADVRDGIRARFADAPADA
jgi:hypothetical protein